MEICKRLPGHRLDIFRGFLCYQFEQMVADFAGAKYGVAAVNGTTALHIAYVVGGKAR